MPSKKVPIKINKNKKSILKQIKPAEMNMELMKDTLVLKGYEYINNVFNFRIREDNIIDGIVLVMQVVEKIYKIKKHGFVDKKIIAIEIVKSLINISVFDDESKGHMNYYINQFASPIIDYIIQASKGELELNEKIKLFCFPCIQS